MKMSVWLLPLAFGPVLLGGCRPGSSPSDEGGGAVAAQTVRIHVAMHCGEACPPRIEKRLRQIDGVVSVDVDYPTLTVTVGAAEGVDPKALVDALARGGLWPEVSLLPATVGSPDGETAGPGGEAGSPPGDGVVPEGAPAAGSQG